MGHVERLHVGLGIPLKFTAMVMIIFGSRNEQKFVSFDNLTLVGGLLMNSVYMLKVLYRVGFGGRMNTSHICPLFIHITLCLATDGHFYSYAVLYKVDPAIVPERDILCKYFKPPFVDILDN